MSSLDSDISVANRVHAYARRLKPRALPVCQGVGPFPVCHANVDNGKNTLTNEVIQMSTPHLWILNDTLRSVAAPSIELHPATHTLSPLRSTGSQLINQSRPDALDSSSPFICKNKMAFKREIHRLRAEPRTILFLTHSLTRTHTYSTFSFRTQSMRGMRGHRGLGSLL